MSGLVKGIGSAVGGIAKGVGKVFQKAAPIILPIAGGLLGGPVGAMAGSMASGLMGGAGPMTQALGMGASIFGMTMATPMSSPNAMMGALTSGQGKGPIPNIGGGGGGIAGWIENNPNTTKLIGGALGGLAEGYQRSKDRREVRKQREELARQFDESQKFSGAFYGVERSGAGAPPDSALASPERRRKFF